jgi:hypothetical protein
MSSTPGHRADGAARAAGESLKRFKDKNVIMCCEHGSKSARRRANCRARAFGKVVTVARAWQALTGTRTSLLIKDGQGRQKAEQPA